MNPPPQPQWMTWTGRGLTALAVAGLLFSAAMKFSHSKELLEGLEKMGYDEETIRRIGIVEAACAIIFLVPQTSVLGAILITGYLGGATSTHVRIHDNFAAPVILGVLVWLALFLRDRRIRSLIPLRTNAQAPYANG